MGTATQEISARKGTSCRKAEWNLGKPRNKTLTGMSETSFVGIGKICQVKPVDRQDPRDTSNVKCVSLFIGASVECNIMQLFAAMTFVDHR